MDPLAWRRHWKTRRGDFRLCDMVGRGALSQAPRPAGLFCFSTVCLSCSLRKCVLTLMSPKGRKRTNLPFSVIS